MSPFPCLAGLTLRPRNHTRVGTEIPAKNICRFQYSGCGFGMQWVAAQKSSGTNRRKDVRKTLPKTGSQNTVFRSDKAGSKVIRETVVLRMTQSDIRECQPGEIYSFKEASPDARHPFAIVGPFDDEYYLGCITHSNPKQYPYNIPMDPRDFEQEYSNGKQATITYSEHRGTGSHFVGVALFKKVDLAVTWSGQLSTQGLEKMRKAIEGSDPEMWGQYKVNSAQRLKTSKGKK